MMMNNKEMKVKYLKGWLKHENMIRPEWITVWIHESKQEEENGYELVVFKLPQNKSAETIQEMEILLQEKFK